MGLDETTQCIRCDREVIAYGTDGLTLVWRHEKCAVRLCEDCSPIAEERNYW